MLTGERSGRRAALSRTLVAVLSMALAGCAGEQVAPGAPEGKPSTATGETGGRYVAVDDTGLPPSPIERGWMVAIPADVARDVLGQPHNDDWSHHFAEFEEDEIRDTGGAWEPIGPGGRFDLPVEPGTWVVCGAGDGRGTVTPRTTGCYEITIADGDRLLATKGEAGFWIGQD